MINTTEQSRLAHQRMNERFEALQAIHKRMEAIRATGARVDYGMYAEWEEAYRQFHLAHETWKALATFPKKPPTNPMD
jgi:hypothetical protein